MNNAIINPWVFYWMELSNNLKHVLGFFGSLLCVVGFVFYVVITLNSTTEEEVLFSKKCFTVGCTGVVMSIISLLIPSEATIYKMIAAQYITRDVAVKSLDYINNLAQQLINGMK